MPHILIADDDQNLLDQLNLHFKREGYQTTRVSNGEEALSSARRDHPDIILLELLLPILNGCDITRILKSDPNTRQIPVIMVTDKGEESDMLAGFESGATDYITKPYSIRVLLARVRTILRRFGHSVSEDTSKAITIQKLTIWPNNLYVTIDGHSVQLTPLEFNILLLLVKHDNRYFTRMQILDSVKADINRLTERSVDVHVSSLRKKLGTYGELIETVHHLGYRLRR